MAQPQQDRRSAITRIAFMTMAITLFAASSAQADCKIFGIEYATGASTQDLAGTRIWCNTRGQWQSNPLIQFQPYSGPDGRFRPTILPPRLGSQDWYRYQANPQQYRQQEAYRRYGRPPAPVYHW